MQSEHLFMCRSWDIMAWDHACMLVVMMHEDVDLPVSSGTLLCVGNLALLPSDINPLPA